MTIPKNMLMNRMSIGTVQAIDALAVQEKMAPNEFGRLGQLSY